jgi:hypothetical protein
VGRFIDANPLASASDFAVQVAWGDGTTSAGTIVPYQTAVQLGGSGVEFAVEASHTNTTTGNFNIITTVNDVEGASVAETTPVVVSSSSLTQITAAPINAVEGQPFTGNVASFNDPNPSDTASSFTATINWGNGDSTSGTVVGSGPTFTVTGVDRPAGWSCRPKAARKAPAPEAETAASEPAGTARWWDCWSSPPTSPPGRRPAVAGSAGRGL